MPRAAEAAAPAWADSALAAEATGDPAAEDPGVVGEDPGTAAADPGAGDPGAPLKGRGPGSSDSSPRPRALRLSCARTGRAIGFLSGVASFFPFPGPTGALCGPAPAPTAALSVPGRVAADAAAVAFSVAIVICPSPDKVAREFEYALLPRLCSRALCCSVSPMRRRFARKPWSGRRPSRPTGGRETLVAFHHNTSPEGPSS